MTPEQVIREMRSFAESDYGVALREDVAAWADAIEAAMREPVAEEAQAEIERLREAVETALECLENNGFGRAYAVDMLRAALAATEEDKGWTR